jgi:hypothetical protein
MMDIEVREERKPPRGEHSRGGRDRGKDRGRDGKHRDRRPPGGKFHDQVASMDPVEAAPEPHPIAAEAPRPVAPREQPRQESRQEQRPRSEPRPENRDRNEKRGSQRQHNEQAAKPEAVDKSQLPAFLFRPVPVKKPEPQTE